MQLKFTNLNAADLRSRNRGEILVHVEADLTVVDGERVIYTERAFPVFELAIALWGWMNDSRHVDFEFASDSFDDEGAIRIIHSAEGWRVGSIFESDTWSDALKLEELMDSLREFISQVDAASSRSLRINLSDFLK